MTLIRLDPADPSSLILDNRQSEKAAEICRGVMRVLSGHGSVSLIEVSLPNGRRADIMALARNGTLAIVEIKSSLEDFRVDQKWPDYRAFCDELYFAVATDFPRQVIPEDTGLVIADRFGGEIVRAAPVHRLAGARRKAITLHFARVAAGRLAMLVDPAARMEPRPRE